MGDAVIVEKLPRHPAVLAGDHVRRGKGFQRPERDVAQVADRGGDEVQPGGEPWRLDRLPDEDIGPGSIFGSQLFGHGRHCNNRPPLRHTPGCTPKTVGNIQRTSTPKHSFILSLGLTYRPHYARLPTWLAWFAMRRICGRGNRVPGPGPAGPAEIPRSRRCAVQAGAAGFADSLLGTSELTRRQSLAASVPHSRAGEPPSAPARSGSVSSCAVGERQRRPPWRSR